MRDGWLEIGADRNSEGLEQGCSRIVRNFTLSRIARPSTLRFASVEGRE